MTQDEFHLKWCDELDEAVRRAHMALREIGADCNLIDDFSQACGKTHVNIRFPHLLVDPPNDADLERAAIITMSPEMRADWLAHWGVTA